MKNPIPNMDLHLPRHEWEMPVVSRDYDRDSMAPIIITAIGVVAAAVVGLFLFGAVRRSRQHYVDIDQGEE